MDPRALAQHIADTLDGEWGPDDEGFFAAGYEQDRDAFFVVYYEDEDSKGTRFRLTISEDA